MQAKYDSWRDWLLSPGSGEYDLQEMGSAGVVCARLRGTEAFCHPVTPDVTIELLRVGDFKFHHLDQGHGRWSGALRLDDFLVTPASYETALHGVGDYEVLVVALPWSRVTACLGVTECGGAGLGRLHAGANRDATCAHLVRLLWESAVMGGRETLFADGIITALVARLLHLSETPLPQVGVRVRGLGKTDLKRVTDYIGDNLAGDISLETLAGVVAVSPFHFCRLFKQSTGLSPHQYVIRARLERAESLLRRGNTLTQAAHAVGLADAAHLSRHRKRVAGVSPST